MSYKVNHPAHLVDNSPWPLVMSFMSMGVTVGLASWFHSGSCFLFILSLLGVMIVSFQWWRDVSRESSLLGSHSHLVELGMRWGMVLFITSEVMFFVSFFWAFFHSSLGPSVEVGSMWPPMGLKVFNPFGVPMLNSIVLISSGVSVTWSHHALMENDFSFSVMSLKITVALGVYFSFLQGMEYYEASFNFSDGTYGSTFFLATGFHGIHVIIGSIFLAVTLFRLSSGSMSPSHCFGFEAAAWYWHFVDVVWLFLFVWIYWWGYIF